jgi:hypothetical protein
MRDEGVDPNLEIVIDCADPRALATFWAAALGFCAVGFREPYFCCYRRAEPFRRRSCSGCRNRSGARHGVTSICA